VTSPLIFPRLRMSYDLPVRRRPTGERNELKKHDLITFHYVNYKLEFAVHAAATYTNVISRLRMFMNIRQFLQAVVDNMKVRDPDQQRCKVGRVGLLSNLRQRVELLPLPSVECERI